MAAATASARTAAQLIGQANNNNNSAKGVITRASKAANSQETKEVPPGPAPGLVPLQDTNQVRSPSPPFLVRDDFQFLSSADEVKIFNEEGEADDEDLLDIKEGGLLGDLVTPGSRLSEIQAALLEEKSSLIQETEMGIKEEFKAIRGPPGQAPIQPQGPPEQGKAVKW